MKQGWWACVPHGRLTNAAARASVPFIATGGQQLSRVATVREDLRSSLSAYNACAARQTLLAALQWQHRRCCTVAPASVKSPPTCAADVRKMTEAEFKAAFFTLPVAQRDAAITVAKFHLASQAKRQPQLPAKTSSSNMPMFDFVERISPLVRDDIFRSQQDALKWVEASPLLEIVEGDGTIVSKSSLLPQSSMSRGEAGKDRAPPLYNPLLHVCTVVPAEWVVGAAEVNLESPDKSPGTEKEGSSRPTRDAETEETSAAVRASIVRALQTLEKRAHRQLPSTRGEDEELPADAEGSRSTPRAHLYIPVVDVLRQLHNEAASAPANVAFVLSPATTRALKTLSMERLEIIIDMCGVPVTVGRRARPSHGIHESAPAYPAVKERFLWVVRGTKLPNQRRPPAFVALRDTDESEPPRFRSIQPRTTSATADNGFGGWGAAENVPTKAGVYEILKYVPVNWGNLGNLNIPANVKKAHMRCSSSLQWFRRQPYYFELRNLCNTIDIRRSIVLHPEAHGLTKEEAWEILELQLATGEANNLVYLASDGAPSDDGDSLLERAAVKFLLRVSPTYFAPISLIAQRYVKKNLSEPTMLALIRRRPQDFEVLTTRFSDVVMVRRRGGADSARWRDAFVADLEKYPEDVRGIMVLCGRMCPSWDRPEFIYVRLSPDEQHVIGGYAGMMRVLERHPTIFRVGKHFVSRADPSDPLTLQEVEPASNDVTARSPLREENPYQSAIDIALVFHYVAPDDEPCTAAYLADCVSPAIRCVLPTRIVTIVQQFPRLFACTETEPGVFAIRKLKQRTHKPTPRISGVAAGSGAGAAASRPAPTAAGAATAESEDAEMIQMLEDELAEEDHMTKAEVIAAVRTLVPDSGVEASQLLLWASMNVQRAANEYFGGVVKLAEALPQHFRVVATAETKMVYRKDQDASVDRAQGE